MTDALKLYTPTEARELAPHAQVAALEEWRAAGGDEPEMPSEATTARLLLLTRALEVRCTRSCDHSPRVAILSRGVDCCMRCRFQFADARARGDERCDTCNALAPLTGVRDRLVGGVVTPVGVMPAIEIAARVCPECLALLEAERPTAQRGAWN
jgi:hypothetical protein